MLESVARLRLEREPCPGDIASVLIVANEGAQMWATVFDCAEEVVVILAQHAAIEQAN
ncbi:MAG: hypothetical protein ACYCQK_02090 [Acidiferrobacteraceae bacterium]